MKTIDRGVTRRTRDSYQVLYARLIGAPPGYVLEFREHGRRGRWLLVIDSAFKYAARLKPKKKGARRK